MIQLETKSCENRVKKFVFLTVHLNRTFVTDGKKQPMLRYSAKDFKALPCRRLLSTLNSGATTETRNESHLSQQKQLREKALSEALAREEEAIAKEKALRELKMHTKASINTLNSIPTTLIQERLHELQSQLNSLDQSKVQSLNSEMEQFLLHNMKLPRSETKLNPSVEPSNLIQDSEVQDAGDPMSQVIKTTATSAYVSEYPNLKPTPDYKPYSSQELFLRQLSHMRKSGKLGSTVTGVYNPSNDVQHPRTVDEISIATLMAAGCHLGHSKAMWRPSTQPFICGEYLGIHLIDLNETLSSLKRASKVIEAVASKGGIILYVGTSRTWEQYRSLEEAAKRSKGYYVSHRWIPGTITNFTEVSKQIGGSQEIELDLGDEPTRRVIESELKLLIKPDLVVILNPVENRNCINECINLRIPTIGLCDTNMEPSLLTYPIPSNDDSTRASSLVLGVLSEAAQKGVYSRYQTFLRYKSKSASA